MLQFKRKIIFLGNVALIIDYDRVYFVLLRQNGTLTHISAHIYCQMYTLHSSNP